MKKPNFKIDEIALVFVVAVLAIAVSVYEKSAGSQEIDAEKITGMILDDHYFSFANNGVVDENKLNEVKSIDYNDLKKSLKAKNDFCMFLQDENGNIILAKGSPKLSKDGVACG